MWALRAALQLAVRVAVALAIALVVAAIWALARGGGFVHALSVGCFVVGGLTILLGAMGQSAYNRNLETAGRLPGVPAWTQTKPGDTTLATGAVFFLAGLALIAIGLAISAA